jgi:hypothetical protein
MTLFGNGSGNNTGDWQVRINANGKPAILLCDQSAAAYITMEAQQVLSTGTWYHIAFVYGGTSNWAGSAAYINGSAVSTSTSSGGTYVAMEDTTHPLVIGNQYSGGAYNTPLYGHLSNIRGWNIARSAAEILAMRDIGIQSHPNLVFSFICDQRETTTVISDYAGNFLDATFTGTAVTDFMMRPFDGLCVDRLNAAGVKKSYSFSYLVGGIPI